MLLRYVTTTAGNSRSGLQIVDCLISRSLLVRLQAYEWGWGYGSAVSGHLEVEVGRSDVDV